MTAPVPQCYRREEISRKVAERGGVVATRQDTSEVERLRAALAEEQAERERLADKLAQVLDHMYAASALPATAGGETGPLPSVHRPQSHRAPKDKARRIPRDKWWLSPVPVVAAIVAVRRAAAAAHPAAALGAPVTAAALTAAVVALGPVHTLEDRMPVIPPLPGSATVPSAAPRLPVNRLAAQTQPALRPPPKGALRPLVVYVPPPVPVPVVTTSPAPVVTESPAPQDTSWPGSGSPSQPYDWQAPAQGKRSSSWSPEGNSGYQPRHGSNDQGNYWQQGRDGSQWQQQGNGGDGQDRHDGNGGGWQGGQQQDGGWQGGHGGNDWQHGRR